MKNKDDMLNYHDILRENMNYIDRFITKKLLRMLDFFPSVVVVGARQVGKSTMLKHLFPNYSYVLFDPEILVASQLSAKLILNLKLPTDL